MLIGKAPGESVVLLGHLRDGGDIVGVGQQVVGANDRSRLEEPRGGLGVCRLGQTGQWLAGGEFVERAGGVGDVGCQPQGLVEERSLFHVMRPELRDDCGRTEECGGDAGGGDVHEQGLVVRAEVVPGRAVEGEAALEAEVIAVSRVGEDSDGAAEASEVEDLADAVASRGGGGRCVSEVVVEKMGLVGDGRGVEPGHGLAREVGDVRERHKPAGQIAATRAGCAQDPVDAAALLEEVAEEGGASGARIVADPKPAQAVDEHAAGDSTQNCATEACADHGLRTVVSLAGGHEREPGKEPVAGECLVEVDGKLVEVQP